MKKFFNFLPLMALVFGLGFILTMSSFKGGSTLTQPADGWFEVSVIDPLQSHSDPTNLRIDGRLEEAPADVDEEGCARTLNTGDLCAVYLTFTPNAITVPAKISDVTVTNESITDDANSPL